MKEPPAVARAPRPKRVVDGIVLLDKPQGLSSNRALQRVRHALAAVKAGHAGTLDPLATGMLPLCFGQATKACGTLLGASKAYRVELELGTATSTGDREGDVTASASVAPLDPANVAQVLRSFVGQHDQLPPMFSALKHEGRPLYEIARGGGSAPRHPRRIRITRLELLRCEPAMLEFDVQCSKGTYVRVLGEDIARRLGTVGHLRNLRRLWVEPFEGERMVELETIEQWAAAGESSGPPAWLLPVDRALISFPRLELDAGSDRALRQGRAVPVGSQPGTWRVYAEDGSFLGLVEVDESGIARVRRLFIGAPPGSPA